MGFFDTTKTGDITSRLSSDTTLVGDQVTLNVNVFLRSLVQAIGILIFMFVVSWQLSIIAFISVPVVTALSKWVRCVRISAILYLGSVLLHSTRHPLGPFSICET